MNTIKYNIIYTIVHTDAQLLFGTGLLSMEASKPASSDSHLGDCVELRVMYSVE